MSVAKPQAVFFDLDGTLIDSAPDLGAAADKMRTDRGMNALPIGDYRQMAGAGARGMLGVAFGITPDMQEFAALRDEFFRNYEERMLLNTYLFSDVDWLIDELVVKGLPWGIVTNKASRFTDPLVASIRAFATAGVVISGDTTPHSKPHPEPLLEAARRLGVDPARCLYVGDDERDIVAGRAAGMRTVAARYGYMGASADAGLWNADHVIESPSELLKWL